MLIYLGTFLLSYIFCYIGEKKIDSGNRQRIISIFFLTISVLIVSILAGVRDLNIGTDIWTYAEWLFRSGKKTNDLASYISNHTDIDILYLVFTYVISNIFNDSHWLYFFTGVIIYGFTLMGLLQYRKKCPTSFSWLIYLLIFYGDTLNAMRQSIAIAIGFWGMKFALKSDYKKFAFIILISILFHNSAIIFIGIALIYKLLNRYDFFEGRALILIISITLIVSYGKVLELLINLGIMNNRFERYMNGASGLQLNPILIRLPILLLIILLFKRFNMGEAAELNSLNNESEGYFYIFMLIIEILTAEMRAFIPALYRISFYFGIYKTIAYSRIVRVLNGKFRPIGYVLTLMFLVMLWYYQNVIQGNNQIFPYTSQILGIG